jgi:hypothetical protein
VAPTVPSASRRRALRFRVVKVLLLPALYGSTGCLNVDFPTRCSTESCVSDASSEIFGDAGIDVGSDSGAADSGAADSTAVDSDVAADTAEPRGCGGAAVPGQLLCADFDSVTAPGDRFNKGSLLLGAASFGFDNSVSYSAPNSLRVQLVDDTTTFPQSAMVQHEFLTNSDTSIVTIDTWLYLTAATYTRAGGIHLLDVGITNASINDAAYVALGPNGLELGNALTPIGTAVPATDRWVHVRFDAALHPTNGTLRLFVDDMTTPKVQRVNAKTSNLIDRNRSSSVGVSSAQGSKAVTIRYDDVRITSLP